MWFAYIRVSFSQISLLHSTNKKVTATLLIFDRILMKTKVFLTEYVVSGFLGIRTLRKLSPQGVVAIHVTVAEE